MTDVDSASLMVHPDLGLAGKTINDAAPAIADELNKLIAQLQPIADTWTGPAMDYYQPLMNDWNNAADALLGPDGVLGEIAHAMNISWGNYVEAEWSNTQTWKHQ
jgi:uncharacterized protein YukE